MRAAASRTFWTAGSSRPIRMPMMAMTTSSSMRVKPERADEFFMTNALVGTRKESIEPHVLALPDGPWLQRADGQRPYRLGRGTRSGHSPSPGRRAGAVGVTPGAENERAWG